MSTDYADCAGSVNLRNLRNRWIRLLIDAIFLAARSPPCSSLTRALAFDTKRHFAPVKVARNRIIREVVGLRPYRPGGFVVDAQRFGNKLLVHNYGHGGGGVTLSWGTASLAVDLLRDFLVARKDSPRFRGARLRSQWTLNRAAACNAVIKMGQEP